MKKNADTIRKFFENIIAKRREQMKDPNFKVKDFLATLLEDDIFKDNERMIIDECLTFFFAGSQTSAIAAQNLIYLMT